MTPDAQLLESVSSWAGLALIAPITVGDRNQVWSGRLDGRAVAVRRSRRTIASLLWELELLETLDDEGVLVPLPIRTDAGAQHVDGVVVQRWIEGRPPSTPDDWSAVATELRGLHERFERWPQRPGCVAVPDLTAQDRSVDADMSALPGAVVAEVLAVFAEFDDVGRSVIHGDPHVDNIRITSDGRVGLIDWDESRVDVTLHDLSNLGTQVLSDHDHRRAQRLSNAWEAANAWVVEPEYARNRLAALRQG